jgi:membrane-bound lytic murein transglycosylase D
LRSEKESKSGQKHIDITGHTYWYVKKYLAHKIAYEGFTKGSPEIQLLTYETNSSRKSLAEISREVNIDEEQLKLYNKWIRGGHIPDDRSYSVALPVKGDPSGIKLPEASTAVASTTTVGLHEKSTKAGTFNSTQERIKINGIIAIRGAERETAAQLAARAGVDLSAFLKWNDMSISDKVIGGNYYLLGKKRSRASFSYHKVLPGETLWMVSQQYGVQQKKLRKYNRLGSSEEIRPGTTLWLSSTRPKDEPGSGGNQKTVEVNEGDTFAWEVDADKPEATTVVVAPEVVVPTTDSSTVAVSDAKDTIVSQEQADTPVATSTPDSAVGITVQDHTLVIEAKADSVVAPVAVDVMIVRPQSHTVLLGETLYGIARIYKVGVMDLVNWNALDLTQGIKPGQVLRLQGDEQLAVNTEVPAAENVVHEVKSSDTVYSIARKYGVTIKDLMDWNNKKDFTLSVGEKLRILRK